MSLIGDMIAGLMDDTEEAEFPVKPYVDPLTHTPVTTHPFIDATFLGPGDYVTYYMKDRDGVHRTIVVQASKVSRYWVTYPCPFCRTSYNKDGVPRANSKCLPHRFGSRGNTSQRGIADIQPPCTYPRGPPFEFVVYITDKTEGATAPRLFAEDDE